MANIETIGARLNYLIPGVIVGAMPKWPPDAFCLCAALLQASGAYSSVLNDHPPHGSTVVRKARVIELKQLGQRWRRVALNSRALPGRIQDWWKILIANCDLPISAIPANRDVTLALLNILAVADEASTGLGRDFPETHKSDQLEREARSFAVAALVNDGHSDGDGVTLCRQVASSKGRVLPKIHTPQNGLTIRSLSHNLAYTYSPDVKTEWYGASGVSKHHCLNLLVLPWPKKVEPKQFERSRVSGIADVLQPHAYGLFTFRPTEGPSIQHIQALLDEAERSVGKVDGIVLPELALSPAEFESLSEAFVTVDRFLIAGVGTAARGPNKGGTNVACLAFGLKLNISTELRAIFTQKKHHRWKLTKSQIMQYGLASNLHPGADWWEHIEVGERSLFFVPLRTWLTMSLLVCEDLARPDPVGDVLRAVGPNLIVALLCDAPQLLGRWPGRYAGALADDPGSSVLTLTSLGASKLSQPLGGGLNRARTVALWRDAKNGAREIELPDESDALLLNLSVEFAEEWTADGRGDGGAGSYPVLCGVHPITAKQGV